MTTRNRRRATALPTAETITFDGTGDPNCRTCHGQGYVSLRVPRGDARFGLAFPCHDCRGRPDEIRLQREYEAVRERIARYSNRRPLQTFSSFNPTHVNAMIRRAFLAAQVYAENPEGWLVLHGNCGTGKSHLADAITNRRSDRLVMNHTVPALLDLLRSGYENGDHGDLLDLCCNVHLLILDDIGTENPTDWSRKILFRIINHRYNRRLPTVLVFNGKPDDLPPRIASRVSDRDLATTYPMYGDDYRLRKDPTRSPHT